MDEKVNQCYKDVELTNSRLDDLKVDFEE
jgi:hypothetical protein